MKGKKGFTLVELLVVILIIGILASIAIPKYEMSIKRARVMELVAMLDQLQKAVDMYRHEHDGNMGTNVARYLNVKFEGFTQTGDFYCNQRKVCYLVEDSGDITVGQYQDNFTGTGVSEYEVFASHSDNGWGRYYSGDPDLQGMRLEELGFQEDDDAF